MRLCAECFRYPEIKDFIQSSGEKGACAICKMQEVATIEHGELQDFFAEFLQLFSPAETGRQLATFVQEEFDLFSSRVTGERILNLYSTELGGKLRAGTLVDYAPPVKEKLEQWRELKKTIRSDYRFFFSAELLNGLQLDRSESKIGVNAQLYRARIDVEGKPYEISEMGPPPEGQAKAGRANPQGIPYLYLCEGKETTYAEVRAIRNDTVSVGIFRPKSELRIVDFTAPVFRSIFSSDDCPLRDIVREGLVLRAISEDLARPKTTYNSEIEYLSTQMVCEFCKLRGADGVRFSSSLNPGGINIVLFESSKVECESVFQVLIAKTTAEGRELP